MKQTSSNHKIIVMQAGWVVTGEVTKAGDALLVKNGSVIRRWGTEHGLGQLAITGKTASTVLDPFGDGEVPKSSVLFVIGCVAPL